MYDGRVCDRFAGHRSVVLMTGILMPSILYDADHDSVCDVCVMYV